jgi:hypothetical protein
VCLCVAYKIYYVPFSGRACLWQEDGIDLATIIKGSVAFYRRGMYHDYVSDYVPPTPSELKMLYESNRFIILFSYKKK